MDLLEMLAERLACRGWACVSIAGTSTDTDMIAKVVLRPSGPVLLIADVEVISWAGASSSLRAQALADQINKALPRAIEQDQHDYVMFRRRNRQLEQLVEQHEQHIGDLQRTLARARRAEFREEERQQDVLERGKRVLACLKMARAVLAFSNLHNAPGGAMTKLSLFNTVRHQQRGAIVTARNWIRGKHESLAQDEDLVV